MAALAAMACPQLAVGHHWNHAPEAGAGAFRGAHHQAPAHDETADALALTPICFLQMILQAKTADSMACLHVIHLT
jgi:hypothetical protein